MLSVSMDASSMARDQQVCHARLSIVTNQEEEPGVPVGSREEKDHGHSVHSTL